MLDKTTTAVVPPRNDLGTEPVFVQASIKDQNHRPGWIRKWFHKDDPKHPSYYGRHVVARRIGNDEIGYCEVQPWLIVRRDAAAPGRKRDDDNSGLESAQTHGDLILLETTTENYAAYIKEEKLKDEARKVRLGQGDSEVVSGGNGGRATYRARVGSAAESATHRDLLNS